MANDGGNWALAGFLYQILGIIGITASYSLIIDDSDNTAQPILNSSLFFQDIIQYYPYTVKHY